MSKFFSNLVDRTVTPIMPDGFVSQVHKDLPHGVVYQIHTVYLKEGDPVAIAEKVDAMTNPLTIGSEEFAQAPDSVEVWLGSLDRLWRLIR